MIKLFTHNDLDGVGCYILAVLAFGKENVDVAYCDYSNINERVVEYIENNEWMKYTSCYITDISMNEETAMLVEQLDANVIEHTFRLFDHHPTALHLNSYWWAVVNTKMDDSEDLTCGTELFAKYLMEEKHIPSSAYLKKFISTVRDYDTWKWTTYAGGDRCKQLNDLLGIYGKEDFCKTLLDRFRCGKMNEFTETDLLLLKLRQRDIDEYIDRKSKTIIKTTILGYRAGVVFADSYISELGNKLSESNPDVDFIAVVRCDKSVSYRTINPNIDLGKNIAGAFGGGGHRKSAGSMIGSEIKEKIVKVIFS